ncbi:hypothetical protein J3Q64DRAFT_1844010 [Phycomyces blakesleeanus]|uniref:Receptor L-domain domain-containing protein n=2 Tax=Phycomyces blakesleeanus TaxID=4837 RepID=A0A162UQ08_PHYB8|nr:hypothetical protein PHYBLDRAFT_108324 [Phycomyces blakesleeanus NRRL 1555(-)]OAD77392.1 hypothetical protein PHYBLDRAFT_108324 [Phycomyces blakesleeanus NRRL 1555(-)]|eukprot:XP_018295432.1 hypothetical protein PHYBLDRAFT_108324 [Phycomyces blakesleeanus NRRL 1555(-)]
MSTLVTAQVTDCTKSIQVKSQTELDQISACKFYKGTINVSNCTATDLVVHGVETIEGNLALIGNTELLHLSLPDLHTIHGRFLLDSNKRLTDISMPKLSRVGTFEVLVHPSIKDVAFPAGLVQINSLSVTDTTATSIKGIYATKIAHLTLAGNTYLNSIELGNLTHVTYALSVLANAPTLNLNLASMDTIQQGDFRDLAGVSLGHLSHASGDLSFVSNTFTNLSLPQLQQVEGGLSITNNSQLSTMSMPSLTQLGGALLVAKNPKISSLDSFPKLERVNGTVDILGSFDSIKFSDLHDVRGGMSLQTSSSKFQCDDINKLKASVIKGHVFSCKSNMSILDETNKTDKPKDTSDGVGIGSLYKGYWSGLVSCIALSFLL